MVKKTVTYLLVVFLNYFTLHANYFIISGRVVDEKNNPLIGAQIRCKNSDITTVTNFDGEFKITNLSEKTESIDITYLGYKTFSTNISLEKDAYQELEVKMLPNENLLADVEVFGMRRKEPEKLDMLIRIPLRTSEQVQSISVISHKMITDQGVLSLGEAVRNAPGVGVFGTFGGTTESLTARGFRGIPTLKNGVRVQSDFRGHGFLTDMQGVETIQILRGSASLSQGLGGDIGSAAGAINIATKTPHFQNSGNVGLRMGSWFFVRPTFDIQSVMGENEELGFRLNGAFERGDNYRVNVSKDRIYINPSFAWRPDKNTDFVLEMDYLHDSRTPDQGTVNLASDSVNAIFKMPANRFMGFENDRNITDIMTYTARFNRKLGNGFSVRGVYSGSQLATQKFAGHANVLKRSAKNSDYNHRSRQYSGSTRDDNNQLFQLDFIGKDIFTGNIKHTFQVGADYRVSEVSTTVTNVVIVDTIDVLNPINNVLPNGVKLTFADPITTRNFSYGLSAQDVITLNKYLKTSLGVRYSLSNGVTGHVASAVKGGAFDPILGIIISPLKHINLFASFTTTTSLRNAANLLENGTPVGAAKEKQIEIGVKSEWFQERLRFNLTYFDLLNDNLTYEILNDALQGTGHYMKVGKLTRKGLETELTGRLLPTLDVVLGYAYLDAQYKDSPNYVNGSAPMNTAKHTANGWVNYSIPKGSLKNLSFGMGAYYVGERPLAEYTQREIAGHQIQPNTKPFLADAYTTTNVQLGYAFNKLHFRIFINNIFNKIGYTAYYRGGYLNPTDPRNFALTANYGF
ncbi:MAG: TonB-dependent receptor [Porphyromonadaceae bacterium]|nr:TonB-dependent receptor [Porphyromonadaceae bacterium]